MANYNKFNINYMSPIDKVKGFFNIGVGLSGAPKAVNVTTSGKPVAIETIYFRVLYIEEQLGDIRFTKPKRIIKFKDARGDAKSLKEVYLPTVDGYSTYNEMLSVAYSFEAGTISNKSGLVTIKGIPMQKRTNITAEKAKKLLDSGCAIWLD